jgi:hypothetical protein
MTCKSCIDSFLFFITLASFGITLKTATELLILCLKTQMAQRLPPWKVGFLCLVKKKLLKIAQDDVSLQNSMEKTASKKPW